MATLLCVICGAEGARGIPLISGAMLEPVCSPDCTALLLFQRAAAREANAGRPWEPWAREALSAFIRFERAVTRAARLLRIERGPLAREHAATEGGFR